jgi:phage I-like protein
MDTFHVLLNSNDKEYASFITDLKGVELSETDDSSWVQALPMGTYRHPTYGKMVFDDITLNDFVDKWRQNVRGQDLDVDLEHKQFTSEAAGWVTDVKVELNDPDPKSRGLWYKVEWTPMGVEKKNTKAYRYFSADYFNEWTDPTGKTHKNVLNGGALTNRPYLKDMKPIVLSEDDERLQMNREALEKLANSLGITFTADTTDADLQSLVEAAALTSDPDADNESAENDDTQDDTSTDDVEPVLAQLSEKDLNNPAIQALLSERKQTAERIAKLETATKLSEINRQLSDLGNGKFVVIPKVIEKVRAVMLSSDDATGKAVLDIVNALADKNAVRILGEIGTSERNNNFGDNSNQVVLSDFESAARKLSEEKKLSYIEAVEQIATDQPDLYVSYMKAQYSNTVGGAN